MRIIAALSVGAAWVAAGCTLLCLAIVGVAVAARYLFNTPLGWADQVAGWLVMALVLLAAPEAQRRFEHVGVDLAVERLGPRARRAVRLVGVLAVAVVAAVLVDAGLEAVAFSRMIGVMTQIEGVPEWWVQAILPPAAGLLLLVALSQAVAILRGEAPPPPASDVPRAVE